MARELLPPQPGEEGDQEPETNRFGATYKVRCMAGVEFVESHQLQFRAYKVYRELLRPLTKQLLLCF